MATVFNLYDQADSPIGQSVLRLPTKKVVPAQFIPTVKISTLESKKGANINYRIVIDHPLPRQVEGVWKADNHFQARFSFTALQNEIEDEARDAVIDAMIDLLTSQKSHIKSGNATYKA